MIRSNLLKRLFYNWHIKLISVVLAFILWKYVDSLNEKERYLNIALIVKNLPEGYIIVSKPPKYIKIVIKGRDEYISVLDSSDFRAYLDLNYLKPLNFESLLQESVEIPVKIEKINVPRNVVIKDINPSYVTVKIEKLEEKTVKIEPVVVGKPKKGYLVEDIVINPSSVKIVGPTSEIKSIKEIYTKEIDIDYISLTASFDVPLIIKQFKNVKIVGDNYVNVIIKIVEKYDLLDLNSIEVKFLNLKSGLVLIPERAIINVKVRVPVRLSKAISKNNIIAYVDCKNIERVGKFELPIMVEAINENVEIVGYTPEKIEFEAKRASK